jgi:hypothetical protein
MWILKFLPDSLLIFLTHAITVLGILALVAGFFLAFIPLIKNYGRMLKIGGTVLLLIGIYFEGGLAAEMEWRRRVSEMEEKVKVIEKKVVITNTKIQTKVVEKIKVIKEKGQIQKQYIEKEIVKYNDKCVIPKEFIQVVNEAAASPSGGKDE